MKTEETYDAIIEIIHICHLHLERMQYASDQLNLFLPLTLEKHKHLSQDQISYLDQYIFRFSKLQDSMGARLFPLLLETLLEPVQNMAFIDQLNRLEQLDIIDETKDWIEIRKIRNDVAHEYPGTIEDRIEGINLLFEKQAVLQKILMNCETLIKNKRLIR